MSNILKIDNAFGDLPMCGEVRWAVESYESRLQTILSIIKKKTRGLPSANIRPIRQMTVSVSKQATLSMIQAFIGDIRDRFGIDCFQYVLDSASNRVYMLFDWYDREKNQCYYIYKTLQKKIEAMAIYYFDIDCVSLDKDTLRLYLKNRYRLNKSVFKRLYNKVTISEKDKDSSQILDIILRYVEMVCQGKVK